MVGRKGARRGTRRPRVLGPAGGREGCWKRRSWHGEQRDMGLHGEARVTRRTRTWRSTVHSGDKPGPRNIRFGLVIQRPRPAERHTMSAPHYPDTFCASVSFPCGNRLGLGWDVVVGAIGVRCSTLQRKDDSGRSSPRGRRW
ncbi:hypothetical protein CGRA01v4_04650 [Colletotrichum graminicola]|nr:hypothetical protein CGRA01v4_04650 [Colletotrichum graminicola]